MVRLGLCLLMTITIGFLGACGMHPVRPYERSQLARTAVSAQRDTVLSAQRARALDAQEAARDARRDDVAARR